MKEYAGNIDTAEQIKIHTQKIKASLRNQDWVKILKSERWIARKTVIFRTIAISAAAFPASDAMGRRATHTRLALSEADISPNFTVIAFGPELDLH